MKQAHARTHQRSRPGQLSGWRRALFAAYSILFAFVLPLICWGAYAAPGHPHRTPHFVFFTPVMAQMLDPAAPSQLHQHGGADQTSAQPHPTPDKPPVGQATLSLLLFSILTIVLLAAWLPNRIDRRSFVLFLQPPFTKSIGLPILLPPPRLA